MKRESCASAACNNKTGTQARGHEAGGSAGRRAGRRDSPVGVRGLVDDVLVCGEQQQPVLSEIHGHVGGAAASRLLLMERGARRGASPGGGDSWGAETAAVGGGDNQGTETKRQRRLPQVLAPTAGPSADCSSAAVRFTVREKKK